MYLTQDERTQQTTQTDPLPTHLGSTSASAMVGTTSVQALLQDPGVKGTLSATETAGIMLLPRKPVGLNLLKMPPLKVTCQRSSDTKQCHHCPSGSGMETTAVNTPVNRGREASSAPTLKRSTISPFAEVPYFTKA